MNRQSVLVGFPSRDGPFHLLDSPPSSQSAHYRAGAGAGAGMRTGLMGADTIGAAMGTGMGTGMGIGMGTGMRAAMGTGMGAGMGVRAVGAGVNAASHYERAFHARPLPTRAPVLAPAGLTHHHYPTGPLQHGRSQSLTMTDQPYLVSDDELAHLQKLSNDFEPEAPGPLVGQRQSSAAITSQYANADPVYQVKTAALPAKYAYFRTCRGDGHCGWRAIAFTYFEALLRVGDAAKIKEEQARLDSLGMLIDHIGYARDIWIDFAEEAFELLQNLAALIGLADGTVADLLHQTFNDPHQSMTIITFFKLLASAWVQTHPDDFRHFMTTTDNVKQYCADFIEPAQVEIDHIGVAALCEALIKPAGFGLEVWYLDRSPGEEINRSFFAEPTHVNHMLRPNPPMLRLLYRPGHYDILYKAEDFAPPVPHQPIPPQPPLHVAMVNFSDGFVPAVSNVSDVMTMIPGIFPSGLTPTWSSLSYDFSPPIIPSQVSSIQPPFAPEPAPTSPMSPTQVDFISPTHSSHVSQYSPPRHHSICLEQPPVSLPIHSALSLPPPPATMERANSLARVERNEPFRPSAYQLEPGFGSMHANGFQTAIFRNSHFNVAHYLNPEFQPEEWSPDGDYITPNNKVRHKSCSS